ncbi:hypothetical protein ACLOJK_041735 [Asimina triloba]
MAWCQQRAWTAGSMMAWRQQLAWSAGLHIFSFDLRGLQLMKAAELLRYSVHDMLFDAVILLSPSAWARPRERGKWDTSPKDNEDEEEEKAKKQKRAAGKSQPANQQMESRGGRGSCWSTSSLEELTRYLWDTQNSELGISPRVPPHLLLYCCIGQASCVWLVGLAVEMNVLLCYYSTTTSAASEEEEEDDDDLIKEGAPPSSASCSSHWLTGREESGN